MSATGLLTDETLKKIVRIADDIREEVCLSMSLHNPLNSDHEAYSVIMEEIEEYWEEVKKKRAERNRDNMRKELIQIAAMCIRTIVDCHYQ